MLTNGTLLSTATTREQYRIDEPLGYGGFGETYRAWDMVDDAARVIKTMRPDILAANPALATLFESEATAAQAVKHGNVVTTLEYVRAADSGVNMPYMVMEYVAEGDLATYIARQGGVHIEQSRLLDWMEQLAHGLHAIHQTVVHRDMKPQNVLIEGDTLKISDFGLSRLVDEATRTVTAKGFGSPAYMAPETWRNEHATPVTDIYSLGILYFEMATLTLPYSASTWNELRDKHLYTPAPRAKEHRPNLDHRLDALIARMMAKVAEHRYQCAAEIVKALMEIRSTPTPAPRPELTAIAVRAQRTHTQHETVRAQQQAEQDERKRRDALANRAAMELAAHLDDMIEELNATLPPAPLISLVDGMDALDPTRAQEVHFQAVRRYAYYRKCLVLGFFPVAHDNADLARLGIMATGSLYVDKLGAAASKRSFVFGTSIDGPSDKAVGLHMTLVGAPGHEWWEAYVFEEHALFATPQGRLARTRLVFPTLGNLIGALGQGGGIHPIVVKSKGALTDGQLEELLQDLVT